MKNAMERLSDLINQKNSRICAELEIDAECIPKSFQERFYSETMCNEIVYEYFVSYLQIIADIIPAVKITIKKKEMEEVYWNVIEVAKVMGFFVITQINQEDIGYIVDNRVKIITENYLIDSVIISMDIYNESDKMITFLKLLKENGKGAFINIREINNQNTKQRWKIIKKFMKKREPSIGERFFEMQSKVDPNYQLADEYGTVGIAILQQYHYNITNTDTFALICNYEEEQISDIANAFDGNGSGALIAIDLFKICAESDFSSCNLEKTWAESIRDEAIKQKKKINNAINELYYGI